MAGQRRGAPAGPKGGGGGTADEQYPGLNRLLAERCAAGCQVRVALGDPDSAAVRQRGREERFGEQARTSEGFDRTLATWRLESARAAVRFLDGPGAAEDPAVTPRAAGPRTP